MTIEYVVEGQSDQAGTLSKPVLGKAWHEDTMKRLPAARPLAFPQPCPYLVSKHSSAAGHEKQQKAQGHGRPRAGLALHARPDRTHCVTLVHLWAGSCSQHQCMPRYNIGDLWATYNMG